MIRGGSRQYKKEEHGECTEKIFRKMKGKNYSSGARRRKMLQCALGAYLDGGYVEGGGGGAISQG